ncbi:Crp/Fnr family transcriptional regulator [Carboxylicivirga mesophila]|uniref:Crp/Fnr family transcriptional regulator n=1 Tax=Carboxylicivirga mesophila TaxID=1166478 RepID=A0ABS5K8M3_9BACT|nr:Crp/Fnr family transcriptional regulator [Carboxylicivirga mesophila]MBS2211340.1 Crp/Fnr family transcriptional regulator [Carboxylicivirga mesophila]
MELLTKCPLFKGIDYEVISQLLNQIPYQVKKYEKDHMIAQSGEECRSLMIVLKGSVKGEMIDYSGKAIKIEDIEPPRPLAIAFLFGANNTCPVNIVANQSVEILHIPKKSVVSMMQLNSTVLNNFMNIISSKTQFLSDKIRFLSFQTIRGKIAHYLLQLAGPVDGEIILSKSQEELANMFGVTRPSLGRALRELHNEGIIEAKGKSIKIANREALIKQLKK